MARNFNGSSDKIITASNFSLPSAAISMSFWLYSTSWSNFAPGCVSTASTPSLIRGGYTGNTAGATTTAAFQLHDSATGSFTINSGTTLLSKNLWYNIVCVYDTTNGAVLYVDGISTATNAALST